MLIPPSVILLAVSLARCRASLPPQLLVIRAAVSDDRAAPLRSLAAPGSFTASSLKVPFKGPIAGAALHNSEPL